MLSSYFIRKTETKDFVDRLNNLLAELRDKKVIIYGVGEGFLALIKKFPILELNIVAISDMKFEKEGQFKNLRAIPPEKIKEQDFDAVLITQEQYSDILDYFEDTLNITDKILQTVFCETLQNERAHLNYLNYHKFEKTLPKLIKKLKNKKVVIYGAGEFFEVIKHYYDLSELDIVAISDRKFITSPAQKCFGYKAVAPDEILDINPDYVVIATKLYINIFEDLYHGLLKHSKIKLIPLVKKSFWELWREI